MRLYVAAGLALVPVVACIPLETRPDNGGGLEDAGRDHDAHVDVRDAGTNIPDAHSQTPDASVADSGGVPDAAAPRDAGDPCVLPSVTGPNRTIPAANDPRSDRAIYDDYFGQYLPDHADFGWTDAAWITVAWVESLHFPTPPAGLLNEYYHNYFDFNPFNYARPGLAAFDRDDDNATLFASTADPEQIYRHYDPTEWMPAVATTYTRNATTDIMASQFVNRLTTPGWRTPLVRALELCPDCDDVYTPLSHDDLYKVLELRFVRFTTGGPQLSRTFKIIGVDSSGSLEAHARNDEWRNFGTIGGQTATAKWRMELSGQLAQKYWNSETTYIRLMPVLVRASRLAVYHQYYDGRFDRAAGGANDPYARLYSSMADGACIRDCHAEKCQAGLNVHGYGYEHDDNCICYLTNDPAPAPLTPDIYAAGTCETWSTNVWAEDPSSFACGP